MHMNPAANGASSRHSNLTDAGEVVAALPFSGEQLKKTLQFRGLLGVFGEREGFAAGQLQQLAVAKGIGDVEAEFAGLAGAKEFAWAAKLQVGFSYLETVGSAHHGVEARAGLVGHARRRGQDAM